MGAVSFFDDFPPPPEPPHPPRPQHRPWQGPPPGWMGGWLAWRVEMLRSPDLVIVATDFEVFATGVQFAVVTRLRPGSFEDHRRPPMMHPGTPDGPLFGVGFADGRKAKLGVHMPMPDGEPEGPVLWPRGGGGGVDDWRLGAWLWPLPPQGPLTLVAAWPAKGVAERSVALDGAEIADAAERAEKLWDVPDEEPRPGGWYSRSSSTASYGFGTIRKVEAPPKVEGPQG